MLWFDKALGSRRVHFLKAEVVGVPSGLVVDHIGALRAGELGGTIGNDYGPIVSYVVARWHPVKAVVLDPTCNNKAKACQFASSWNAQAWYLLASLHITKPGQFRTHAVRITYEIDAKQYVQTLRWEVEVDSGNENLPSDI